ncbi:hypothetical protein D9619_010105 [Psilocybe cf. subviscida]|uniref:FHA domain-containing protein n=1 Tax=Psilocybe cf. subviscida TaxID=2480587 RepID=A0A8H5F678_9AGAR|nr:hypothetical protein D9619_010105 [Psilocybe cf. subviscida]
MDTTGFNQIGRYGTLSLLKKRTSAAAQGNELVTSFGIDSNDLTFGSSSTCGVRLYYPDVDAVHCKIMFEDRKAFLVIYGSEGVYIDDSWVYPEGSSNSEQPQAIVPLSNDSEFEIHNKRFRFTYPPKEARATIMATPAPVSKRTLRLSMIHSAQVFSPRPSQDPRENLKVLQSPLKGIFGVKTPMRPGQTPTRRRAVSPLKYGVSRPDSDEDSDEEKGPDESKEKAIESSDESEDGNDDEEQIILVETNHPRVVEEERDLVILEQVAASNAPPPPPSPARALQQVKSIPQSQVQNPAAAPPQTPRRKSMSGTALHRAVLIRSAQRAVWRAEKEREDEEEEMEVLGAVEVDDKEEEDEFSDEEDNDVEMRSASSEEVSDPEMEEEEQDPKTVAEQKSLWRKSIERIIPWTFSGSPAKQDDEAEEEDLEVAEEPDASQELQDEEEAEEDVEANDDPPDEGVQDDEEEQEEEEIAPLPDQTPIRRILGSFMTPQPQPQDAATKRSNIFPQTVARPSMAAPSSSATATGPGRLSLGGGEARRVMVQQPWKVRDLVVSPIATTSRGTPGPGLSSTTASPVRRPTEALPTTPMRGPATATAPRATPAVSEEERRAIQERRRSAVREFKDDGFWKDGAPGMSPAKSGVRGGAGDRRSQSTSPVKMGGMGSSMGSGMTLDRPTSPTKGRSLGYAIAEEEGDSSMSMSYNEPKAAILAAVVAKQSSRNRSKSSDRGERDEGEDEEAEDKEDTQILLERMRETVEDMKRRRSIVQTPRVGGTPMTAAAPGSVLPSLPIRPPHSLAAGAGTSAAPQVPSSVALATPHHRPSDGGVGVPFRMGSVKKIDFSHITPAATSMRRGKSPVRPLEHMVDVASTSAVQSEMEMEVEKGDDDEPFSLLRPAARDLRTPLASTRKPRSKDALLPRAEAVHEQAMPIIEESFLADVPSDEEIEVPKPKSRGRPKVPQTSKAPEVPAEEQAEEAEPARTESKPTKPASKPRSRTAKSPAPEVAGEASTFAPPIRRGRSKTPQPVQAMEDVEEPEQPKRSIPGKRTRRGTAEPEETLAPPATRRGRSKTSQSAYVEENVEEEVPEPPKRTATTSRARRGTAEPEERVAAAAPARRGRKPTVEPEDVEAPEPEPKESKTPAVKRGRKPKVVSTVAEDEEEAEEVPAPVASQAKRSRSRKAVATADNHDDTDSAQPVASGSKTKSSIPVKAAVKGRKKAVTEQQEDVEEDDEPAPLARGRGVKSNIAPPKASTVTKTPAAATTAASKLAKPRGRPKTPATAPAATSRAASSSTLAVGKSEKENTPGDGSNSVVSDEAEEQSVKVRVSRKTTAAATAATAKSSRIVTKSATKTTATKSASKTKAKVDGDGEQEDEAAVAPSKPRATRIMRARTKTG